MHGFTRRRWWVSLSVIIHPTPSIIHPASAVSAIHSSIHSIVTAAGEKKQIKKTNKQNKSTTQTRKEKINSVLVWQWALCIDGTRNVHSEFGGGEG